MRDARDLRHNIMLAANTGVLNDMEGHALIEAEERATATRGLCGARSGMVHTRCSIDVWLGTDLFLNHEGRESLVSNIYIFSSILHDFTLRCVVNIIFSISGVLSD